MTSAGSPAAMTADEQRAGSPGLLALAVIIAVVVTVVGLAVALEQSTYDVWAAFIVGPVVFAAVMPAALWVARHDGTTEARRFFALAAFVKVIGGALARYAVVYGFYDVGDSESYFVEGGALGPALLRADFSELGAVDGTRFIEVVAGYVQLLTGPTRIGGFMVFSAMAFVGTVFLYRAMQVAFPGTDLRWFRGLLFFFPTMVFWPSSIGKDAFMIMCLGIAVFGVASLLNGRIGAGLLGALGLWGTVVVRPHVTLLILLGLAAAVPVASFRSVLGKEGRGAVGLAGTAVAMLVLLAAAGGAVTAYQEKFALDEVSTTSTTDLFTEVNRRTGEKGSSFTTPDLLTPLGIPTAVVTVIFRPFPFEAGSAQEVLSGLEGMVLLGIMWVKRRRLMKLPGDILRRPLVMLAFIYCAGFIVGFVNVENFGILARQRAQFLPLLFVLLAIDPTRRNHDAETDQAAPDVGAATKVRNQVSREWGTLESAVRRR